MTLAARLAAPAVLFASTALGTLGCHAPAVGPPPNAPLVARPLSAMPADLDLVVRLDLKRIRETLGSATMATIGEQAVKSLHGEDSATDALLLSALSGTDTLWLGLRPTRNLEAADSVFVMAGHYSGFDPHKAKSTPRFEQALDLGGDLRRYDRVRPPARSAPARIYVRSEDLVISLSVAEMDSVERAVEQQSGAPPLEPAEKGVLSAVARPRALPPELFASSETLRRLVQNARRLELTADLNNAGVDVTFALKFEDAPTAESVAQALTRVRDSVSGAPGRGAKLAARVELTNAGQYVSLKLALSREELSDLVNCHGSNCAW